MTRVLTKLIKRIVWGYGTAIPEADNQSIDISKN
jgi:hypothetical protein